MDVRLDQWAEDKRRDWSVWALAGIRRVDFVIVIASPDYKRRAEGGVASDDGRGAQYEASLLRELLCADRRTWEPRMLPVVLPGRSVEEIPLFLQPHTATHYIVSDLTEHGVGELLAVLRNQPRHRTPDLGPEIPLSPSTAEGDPLGQWSGRDRAHDQVVDDLARVVAEQMKDYEEDHAIADPRPMRLTWSVTDTARTAMAGLPWEPAGIIAPHTLSGDLFQAGELVGRVPSRRLVVLGQAGAGKTVFTIRLIRDLLAMRSPGDPVPLLLPMGAWNPGEQRLPDWIIARLLQDYKGLHRKVKPRVGPARTLAATLVTTGRIVPILDGLDEIAGDLRGEAIAAINRLGAQVPLLVTSRVDEYLEAISAAGRGLARAAVVELHPLGLAEVRDYLLETGMAGRWQPVLDELDANPDGPLARTLRIPLMLWLARTIYADPATAPGELRALPDHLAVEDQLLDHLIPAIYPDHPTPAVSRRYDARDALAWLAFLARHLRASGTPDLAWWELHHAVRPVAPISRYLSGSVCGFACGLLSGLPFAVLGATVGLLIMTGRFPGLRHEIKLVPPRKFINSSTRGFHNDPRVYFRMLLLLLIFGISVMINQWYPMGIITHVVVLLLALLGLKVWVRHVKRMDDDPIVRDADLDRTSGVATSLRDDRRQALAIFLLTTSFPGLLFGIGPRFAFFGVALLIFLNSAYSRFVLTRLVLALRGRLPWRTMVFLADAHRRGVLRQVGALYQFRHARLRDQLAGVRSVDPADTPRGSRSAEG